MIETIATPVGQTQTILIFKKHQVDKHANQDVMMGILQMEALTECALNVMNHVLHV